MRYTALTQEQDYTTAVHQQFVVHGFKNHIDVLILLLYNLIQCIVRSVLFISEKSILKIYSSKYFGCFATDPFLKHIRTLETFSEFHPKNKHIPIRRNVISILYIFLFFIVCFKVLEEFFEYSGM